MQELISPVIHAALNPIWPAYVTYDAQIKEELIQQVPSGSFHTRLR